MPILLQPVLLAGTACCLRRDMRGTQAQTLTPNPPPNMLGGSLGGLGGGAGLGPRVPQHIHLILNTHVWGF